MSEREQKLEAALRGLLQLVGNILKLSEAYIGKESTDGSPLDKARIAALDALATPSASEWNEAIEAAAKCAWSGIMDYCQRRRMSAAQMPLFTLCDDIRALKHKEQP